MSIKTLWYIDLRYILIYRSTKILRYIAIYRIISRFYRYILIYRRHITIYLRYIFSFLRYIAQYIRDISQKWTQYIAIYLDISWYVAIYHDILQKIPIYHDISMNFAKLAVTNSFFLRIFFPQSRQSVSQPHRRNSNEKEIGWKSNNLFE